MNIKIFMQTVLSDREHSVLMNVGQGLKTWADANDSTVSFEFSEEYVECDLAVMIGSWKPRDKGHHIVRSSVAANAKQFICLETALLGRKTLSPNTHYRVGINGFLYNGASWPELDSAAGQQRLDHLGMSNWPGWRNNRDGHVLVALQLPGDASLRGADINEWALNTVRDIRRQTQRPIVIRSHPLISDRGFISHAPLAIALLTEQIPGVRYSHGAQQSWEQDLSGAYCTVTYTSGLAIDSVIAGIPTIACDPGNFAFDISSNFIQDLENLEMAKHNHVLNWLQNLALWQWTPTEMSSAKTWNRYMPIVQQLQQEQQSKESKKKDKSK